MKKIIILSAILCNTFVMYAQNGKVSKTNPNIILLPGDEEAIRLNYPEAVGYAKPETLNPNFKLTICKLIPTSGYPDFKAGAPATTFSFKPYENTHLVAKCNFNPGKQPSITQVDVRWYRVITDNYHEFTGQKQLLMSAYKVVNAVDVDVAKPGLYEIQVVDFPSGKFLYSTKFMVKQ